jgi:hypothetical protein
LEEEAHGFNTSQLGLIAPVAAVFGVNKGQLGQGKQAILIALCEETSMQLLQCLLRLVIELFIQA